MSPLTCQLSRLFSQLLQIYIVLMLAYAAASWIPSLRGRWLDYVTMAVEPVLTPVRRVIPPIAGLDLSFLIVILVVQWLSRAIVPNYCFFA